VCGGFCVDAILGTAQGFTVDGDRFAGEGFAEVLYPSGKEALKACGIDLGEEPAEGIMGGDAIGQFEEFFKLSGFGAAEFSHVGPGVRPTDDGAQRDHEHVVEVVTDIVVSGVLNKVKVFVEGRVVHGITS